MRKSLPPLAPCPPEVKVRVLAPLRGLPLPAEPVLFALGFLILMLA